jgi:lipoprotein-releasing system permease protein
MQSFEAYVAQRYLKTSKKNAFVRLMVRFSICGIAIGVFAMVTTMALMNGFREEIQNNLFSATAHFTIASLNEEIPNTKDTLQRILNTAGVVAASPIRIDHGLLRPYGTNEAPVPIVVKAIEPTSAQKTSSIFDSLYPMTIEKLKVGEIIIGKELANSLDLRTGDSVATVFLRMNKKSSCLQPKMVNFQIAGLFQSNISEYDKHWSFIHIEDAMRLAESNQAEMIEVKTKCIDSIEKVKPAVLSAINTNHSNIFFAHDLRDSNKALFAALRVEKWLFVAILAFIVVIAAFNIIGSLILLVTEKRRDLGLLLTLGATPKQIQYMFELQGLYIGTMGTIWGLGLAIPFCVIANKYKLVKLPPAVYDFITFVPFRLYLLDIILIAIFPLIIAWMASRYPSRRAAHIDPIKILRSE